MSGRILLLFAGLALVSGRSPQSQYIEEILRTETFGERFSDNIKEDAKLDVVSDFKIYL